jgi:hypothetical protein
VSGEQGTGPGGSPRLRLAEVFDGRGPGGQAVVDRPPVDPAEFEGLVGYLTKAPVALATTKTGEDEMAPGAGLAVPRAYHTDGEWIWPAAVGYYLHRYRLPPQPALVEHIRARGFRVGAVGEELRQAAARQMLEDLAAAKRNGGSGAAAGSGAAGTPGVSAPAPAPIPAPVPPPAQVRPEVREAEPTLWMPAPVEEAAGADRPQEQEQEQGHDQEREHGDAGAASGPVVEHGVLVDGVYQVAAFSPAFTAAGNRHAAWVYEQIETFLDYMPVDDWSVDHATGRYRQAGREFRVDALGRLSHDGRWYWAWGEADSWSADNPALTERSRLLRDEGDRLGIKELTSPVLGLAETADADDPEVAAEMLAWTAMGVAGARGYIGHTFADEGRVYYLAFDEPLPAAEPDIDGAAHFLSHGTAKFDEDATDCVIGYVEHYGWDWSRSAEGIVVSAGELGSFTVELSENGVLTGISLHE